MKFLDLLWIGARAGVPVGIALGALMTVRRRTLRELLKGVPFVDKIAPVWGLAILMGGFLGVVAAWVYDFVRTNWGWSSTTYLALAVGLAILLSVLAFLPVYGGKRMVVAPEISALNLIVGVGFGLLVPWIAG